MAQCYKTFLYSSMTFWTIKLECLSLKIIFRLGQTLRKMLWNSIRPCLTHKYKPSRGKRSNLFCVEHQGRTKRFTTLTLGLVFQLRRGRPNEAETERGDFMPRDPRIHNFHCNSQMGPISSSISLLESLAGGKHLTFCKIFKTYKYVQ